MNPGDKVTRNPQYKWCFCELASRGLCWCRKSGEWKIVATKTFPCQSGTMVIAEISGHRTDWLDSEHFLVPPQRTLF